MLLEFMNRKSVLKQKNKVAIMSLLMEIQYFNNQK
jgi:hypothetical protein